MRFKMTKSHIVEKLHFSSEYINVAVLITDSYLYF